MSTFLSRVEFGDFRTFGRFRLDVAPGPGLTLLVGPNGLGKSTFFDGLEWCLTGRVRRFADYVGRRAEGEYLTRRDAGPDSHTVSIRFDRGAAFTRTAAQSFDEAALLDVLKAPGWGPIRDVGAYLALTHFLGQAAQQRFTSRTRNDQWQALQGPSGIDRLEQVRTALRGNATTAAFRRRSAQEAAEVEVAEQALSRWRDDARRLAQLRAAARAAGAPGADVVARDLALFEAACVVAGIDAASGADGRDLTMRLVAAREGLDAELAVTLAQWRRTERMQALAARYDALAAAADPDGTVARGARSAVEGATAAATEASLAGRAVERGAIAAAEAVARAELALARSVELAAAAAAAARLNTAVAALSVRRERSASEVAAADAARETAFTALANGRARTVARRSLEDRRDADVRIVERAEELVALELQRRLADEGAQRSQAAAEEARLSTAVLEGDLARLRSDLATAGAELATARRRASEMAGALAVVARHVGAHDERCPVCASAFPAGELKALADAAARGRDVELADRERVVERISRSIDAAEADLAALAEHGTHAATARRQAVAAAEALDAARAEVAAALGAVPDEDLRALAAGRLVATKASLAEAEARFPDGGVSEAELEAAAAAAARAQASLAAEAEALATEMAAAERRSVEVRVLLSAAGDAQALASRVDADRASLVEARSREEAATVESAAALAVEAVARQRLDAAIAERARIDAAIAAATSERRDLSRLWAAEGRAGEPSDRAVADHVHAVADRRGILDGLLAEADRLAAALDGLAAGLELSALAARMAESAGDAAVADPSAHERTLLAKLGGARAALRATGDAQRAVNAYTVQLKSKADRFSTDFLQPLNNLIDDFNRILLNTPGETVQFSAEAAVNRTDLGMRLRYADEVDNSRYDTGLAPQLVLSEGQMAANGFSILCAASVAYPWSQWRALLLDDPLQHNDLIHAAAFADVMRNLVEYEGYQLLMSSHDRAEGEFLFRKFDAADLPCTMVTLTAPSRDGVLSEPPRHNGAASRLLARPLAAAG